MLLISISSSSTSTLLWNKYPQLYGYLVDAVGEKDNDKPVYWEQYYSDIEDDYYDHENVDDTVDDDNKFPRQLQDMDNGLASRDKRRQVFVILYN